MPDYYTAFKPEAETRCKGLFKTVSDLKAQLPRAKKRLQDETVNRDNLKARIEKLQDLSIESLAGSQGDFDKYKTSIKKLQSELAVSEEIVTNIETTILPNAESRLKDAEMNLKIVLNQLAIESKKDCNGRINQILRDCITEYDAFLDSFRQIFQDYGSNFICSDENFCPGPWPAREVEEMRLSLGMVPATAPSYEQVWENYNEQTQRKYAEAVPAEETPAQSGPVVSPSEVEAQPETAPEPEVESTAEPCIDLDKEAAEPPTPSVPIDEVRQENEAVEAPESGELLTTGSNTANSDDSGTEKKW